MYFQRPGVEAEFEADLTRTFRLLLTGLAGENDLTLPPGGGGFLDLWRDPATLPDWVTDADVKAFADEFAGAGFTGPLNWYRNLDRNWALTAAWQDAPVTPPALMLAGELDPTVSRFDPARLERSMRAHIPNLEGLEMVPGAGHWLQQERPDLVNAQLVDFVTSTSQ